MLDLTRVDLIKKYKITTRPNSDLFSVTCYRSNVAQSIGLDPP